MSRNSSSLSAVSIRTVSRGVEEQEVSGKFLHGREGEGFLHGVIVKQRTIFQNCLRPQQTISFRKVVGIPKCLTVTEFQS